MVTVTNNTNCQYKIQYSAVGTGAILTTSIGALGSLTIDFGTTDVIAVKISNGINPSDNPSVQYPLAPIFGAGFATRAGSYPCGGIPQPFTLVWAPVASISLNQTITIN